MLVVAALWLLVASGIWIYTSQIFSREQALISQVVPELDLAYELTAVSSEFQAQARLLEAAPDVTELEDQRQSIKTIIASTDLLLIAIQERSMDLGDALVERVADIGQLVDALADIRASQLNLAKAIDEEGKQLFSYAEKLEKNLQKRIVDLTDQQLNANDIAFSLQSPSALDKVMSDTLIESLTLFEKLSLSLQDYLILIQDLVALESIVERTPLLTTPAAVTQAMQQRDLLINSMVNRIIYLADPTQKREVLEQITQIRNAMRADTSLFAMQHETLALGSDQLALRLQLARNTEIILANTDKLRASTRTALTGTAEKTLETLSNYRRYLLLIVAMAFIVLGWIAYSLLYRRTLVPLLEITGQLEKIGTQGFEPKKKYYAVREMSALSTAVEKLDEAQKGMLAKDKLLNANIDQLRIVNDDLEQFAHVASHDLQEPLRKLQQFSDLLVEDYESVLDSDGKFFLSTIKNSAARMSLMIKDTLAYSRSGRDKQSKEPVDLKELLHKLFSEMELAIQDAQATVQINALPSVVANRTGVEQLFRNLLINALKYRNPDTTACITVFAEYDQSNQDCTITVQDNGIGISDEHYSRIFTPFERLNSEAVRGTGLGLAICKKVCLAHDWNIEVESQFGEGSRFLVRIPSQSVLA